MPEAREEDGRERIVPGLRALEDEKDGDGDEGQVAQALDGVIPVVANKEAVGAQRLLERLIRRADALLVANGSRGLGERVLALGGLPPGEGRGGEDEVGEVVAVDEGLVDVAG